jgi:hypothetical protein
MDCIHIFDGKGRLITIEFRSVADADFALEQWCRMMRVIAREREANRRQSA